MDFQTLPPLHDARAFLTSRMCATCSRIRRILLEKQIAKCYRRGCFQMKECAKQCAMCALLLQNLTSLKPGIQKSKNAPNVRIRYTVIRWPDQGAEINIQRLRLPSRKSKSPSDCPKSLPALPPTSKESIFLPEQKPAFQVKPLRRTGKDFEVAMDTSESVFGDFSTTAADLSDDIASSRAYSELFHWLRASIAKAEMFGLSEKMNYSDKWAERLPKRLIDVGRARDVMVHLVPNCRQWSTIPTDQYICLSHRWGSSSQVFRTTKYTLPMHYDGIFVSDLPQNFKHAVVATRRLGYRFLWIDALCIVQDDEQEWLEEGLRMGDIYESAVCTIATHANQPGNGFLAPIVEIPVAHVDTRVGGPLHELASVPRSRRRYISNLNNIPGIGKEISGENSTRDMYNQLGKCVFSFNQDVNQSSLSRRGWVLQERILSRRIIHFTAGGVYWEDDNGVQLPSRLPSAPTNFSFLAISNLVSFGQSSRPSIPRSHDTLKDTPRAWFDTVERYSRCELTRESDKLVAIAGLARRIQRCSGVDYLCGIWSDRLAPGLLWRPANAKLRRSRNFRAPSWSWASLEGEVKFLDCDLQSDIELVYVDANAGRGTDCSAVWLNGDGKLSIETMLSSVTISSRCSNRTRNQAVSDYPRRQIYHRNTNAASFDRNSPLAKGRIGWAVLDGDVGEAFAARNIVCARIASGKSKRAGTVLECFFVLLLQETVIPGEYCRVGMGEIMAEEWIGTTAKTEVTLT